MNITTAYILSLTELNLKRIKHKRVVEELKRRKANGEVSLIICNGNILQWQCLKMLESLHLSKIS